MTDITKLTNETINKGGVLAILYFDLHATSKDMLQQLGAGFIQKLLSEQGVVTALGEIDEPIEAQAKASEGGSAEGTEKKMLSTTIEIKILVKSFADLARICAVYSPFSVEILRPSEIKLPLDKAHELLTNISTTTFAYKKHIVERLSTKEELDNYKKVIQQKMELGKKLLEKKDGTDKK